MSENEQQQNNEANEYAGTPELVNLLAHITKARMAYPSNKKLAQLNDAAQKLMDPTLCQALLLQLSAAQEEAGRVRESPMAQVLKMKLNQNQ